MVGADDGRLGKRHQELAHVLGDAGRVGLQGKDLSRRVHPKHRWGRVVAGSQVQAWMAEGRRRGERDQRRRASGQVVGGFQASQRTWPPRRTERGPARLSRFLQHLTRALARPSAGVTSNMRPELSTLDSPFALEFSEGSSDAEHSSPLRWDDLQVGASAHQRFQSHAAGPVRSWTRSSR